MPTRLYGWHVKLKVYVVKGHHILVLCPLQRILIISHFSPRVDGTQAIHRYKPEQETFAIYTRERTILSVFPFLKWVLFDL